MNAVIEREAWADPEPERERLGVRIARLGAVALGLGHLGLFLAVALGQRDRLWFSYLWAFGVASQIAVGSLFLLGLGHLTRSVWGLGMRRLLEGFAWLCGPLALLAIPIGVSVFVHAPLYPWTHADHFDEVIAGKAPYLDPAFFVLRLVVFFLGFALFARVFVRASLAQDAGRDPVGQARRARRYAPAFFLFFGPAVTFAAVDLFMSLEPHWFSTIFGVYVFAGMFATAVASLTLAVLWARERGLLRPDLVRRDHLYSLGAWLFATACFWAYIAFSQFMLIWYGNLPEETAWYARRLEGGFGSWAIALSMCRFVLPFFLLMSRRAKMNPRVLRAAAIVALAGGVLDVGFLVLPAAPDGSVLVDAAAFLLVFGALGLPLARFARRHPWVCVRDPRLEDCRAFHLEGG